MTWLKLDDTFPEHPKAYGMSDTAKALWVDALCYAHRARTDGHIPTDFVTTRRRKAATELVTRRLWIDSPASDGWLIHGYLDRYPSRAELEDRAKRAAEAGRRGAAKRWGSDGSTP